MRQCACGRFGGDRRKAAPITPITTDYTRLHPQREGDYRVQITFRVHRRTRLAVQKMKTTQAGRLMAQYGVPIHLLPPLGEGAGSRRLVIHKPCLWPCAGQSSHSLLFSFHLYCECPLRTNTPLCVRVLTTVNLRRGCAAGARSAHCGPGPCVRQDCAADPHRTYR